MKKKKKEIKQTIKQTKRINKKRKKTSKQTLNKTKLKEKQNKEKQSTLSKLKLYGYVLQREVRLEKNPLSMNFKFYDRFL